MRIAQFDKAAHDTLPPTEMLSRVAREFILST
jgi:hypothetical protein